MARNVKTLCICLSVEQVERLQREAKALNISVSALARIKLSRELTLFKELAVNAATIKEA